jgi:multidrug efflux pump subunit AcrA (membrane-fusion protein)
MLKFHLKSSFYSHFLIAVAIFLFSGSASLAEDKDKSKGPPPVPVRVAIVEQKMVSDQISLVGTAEAIARSIVAAEVSGVVEHFPVKEGEFVKKGKLLVRLRSTDLKLRLKGAFAAREMIKANLQNAEKELNRARKLKETNSIAEKNFDLAFYAHRALSTLTSLFMLTERSHKDYCKKMQR